MPARRSARLLLLTRVAQAFEPGCRYAESLVNEILKSMFDDHAALRRYLVDEDLMSRTPDGTLRRNRDVQLTGGSLAFASSDVTLCRDCTSAGTWMTSIRSGWSTRRSWNICSAITRARGCLIAILAGRK